MGTGGYLGDLDIDWDATSFSCGTCGEAVQFTVETVVFTVMLAQLTEKGMQYSPLIFEDGDFLYEPNFMCEECCLESIEELRSQMRDVPYVEDSYAVANCHICHSGIRNGEVVGLATSGEVRRSRRSPNNEVGTSTFECTTDDPVLMCVGCINVMNSDVVDELWADSIKQFHECAEGTMIRCWRSGCPADQENPCANCLTDSKTG